MKTLTVDLSDRSYPIHVGRGILADAEALRAVLRRHIRGQQVCVVTNPTVANLHGAALREALNGFQLDIFEMADGEAHKNLASYGDVMDFLMARRHNRTTCLVALGGGVVGDLCGFVAATFQRGVDFIQIPTTLLAQVDSSVGGKTAINHPAGKNMIGAFYQPQCVIADIQALTTLPARQYAAGLAEVVKYGVIVDADFFAWLEAHASDLRVRDSAALAYAVERSCGIKAQVVAQDERETNIRAILNFGHTFGHAIESLSGYGSFLHGEAVAIGMVMAADLSVRRGSFSRADAERITALLQHLDLPVSLTDNDRLAADDMRAAMGMDKKVVDGNLRFVLATRLGAAEVADDVAGAVLAETLSAYCR